MAGKKKLKHRVRIARKPKVVIGGGEAEITSVKSRPRRKRNLWLMACAAVVAIGCVSVVGILTHNHYEALHKRQQLVTEAAAMLDPKDVSKLQEVVLAIQQQPGYDNDPDCLYVATVYYVNIVDASSANMTYSDLTHVYDPHKGYNNPALKHAISLADLKTQVSFAQKASDEMSKGTFGFSAKAPGTGQ